MKTVFIAGGFDLLHKAHISILSRSKKLGDKLIVGINDDEYFKKKGPGRPIDTVSIRIKKLKDTGLVDEIYVFHNSPLELILKLKPDIITVGSDYTIKTTVGWPQCLQWGGKVVVLKRTPNISTTQIIKDSGIKTYVDAYKNINFRT